MSSDSISTKIYSTTTTPILPWTFATSLLATPLISKQIVLQQQSKSLLTKQLSTVKIGPSPVNSVFFGGAMALGGWIINDGDVEDGAGFMTAWSTLYLIVNGKSTFNCVKHGKVWPVVLTSMALTNGYFFGERFFFAP